MKRWRGCFGMTVQDWTQRWLTSVRCSSDKPALQLNPFNPIRDLGYGVPISGARSGFIETGEVHWGLERVKGIEPSYAAWEVAVLPLNYTRVSETQFANIDYRST